MTYNGTSKQVGSLPSQKCSKVYSCLPLLWQTLHLYVSCDYKSAVHSLVQKQIYQLWVVWGHPNQRAVIIVPRLAVIGLVGECSSYV